MKNLLLILTISLLALSCSDDNKDDQISLNIDTPEIVMSNDAAVTMATFTSSTAWTMSLADPTNVSWLSVSPRRGDAGDATLIVQTLEANDLYEDRSASIVINAGGILKEITVVQQRKNALILSQKEVAVAFQSTTIDVELKTNVEYDVKISSNATWVTEVSTKGLNTYKHKFIIAKNEGQKVRIAAIAFRDKASQYSEFLTITQAPEIVDGKYYVEKVGTLSSLIDNAAIKRDTITYMKILGEINEADFATLNALRNLSVLDLSEATAKNNAIPDEAFKSPMSGVDKLTKVYFPANITSIGERAFYQRRSLTGSLTIPEGVVSIGDNAFFRCTGFNGSLTIPGSVTSIGVRAFSYCKGLTGSLNLQNGLVSIDNYAFDHCEGFTGTLTIPSSVQTIGFRAFSYCSGLTGTVVLPNNITELGYNIFGKTAIDAVKLTWATPIAPPGSSGGIAGNIVDDGVPILIPSASAHLYKEKWLGHGVDYNFVEY